MADTKTSALAALATVDGAADLLSIVDVSDTSMAGTGTNKKVLPNNLPISTLVQAALNTKADTATQARTLYVDAVNGNDGTGTVGREDKPYATIAAAKTAAIALTPSATNRILIIVRPAIYTDTDILASYLTVHFEPGAEIALTTLTGGRIASDLTAAIVEGYITGHGRFSLALNESIPSITATRSTVSASLSQETVATVSASLTSNVATVVTSGRHGLSTGMSVVIAGLTGAVAPLNGTRTLASATASDVAKHSFTFNFTNANIADTPDTGGTVERGVISIVTSEAHGLDVGNSATISGMANGAYNGTFAVIDTLSPTILRMTKTNATIGSAADGGGTVARLVTNGAFVFTRDASNVTIIYREIVCDNAMAGGSGWAGISHYNGTLRTCGERGIYMTGGNFPYPLTWEKGNGFHRADELFSSAALGGTKPYGFAWQNAGLGEYHYYVDVRHIKANFPIYGYYNCINTRVWVNCPYIESTGDEPVWLASGYLYIYTEKILAATSKSAAWAFGTGQIWLNAQKISARTLGYGILDVQHSGHIYATVQQFEDYAAGYCNYVVTCQDEGLIDLSFQAWKTHASNGRNPNFVYHTGGSCTIRGGTIDHSNLPSATDAPIIVEAPGLVLIGTRILSPPSAAYSVNTTGSPVTVTMHNCWANKPVHANVTVVTDTNPLGVASDPLKAALASPTFTGTPAAPTAAGGTDTTQLATTAYVQANSARKNPAINAQTGTTYTLALADDSKLVTLSNAAAITLTVPTFASIPLPVGAQVMIAQRGAGQVTVAAAGGVTIRSADGDLKLRVQYSSASLIKLATDEWLLAGDITA